MARPSSFKPEYAEQARRLYLLLREDWKIAAFFDVTVSDLAEWAWEHEEFFDAITPPAEVVEEFDKKITEEKGRRALARRKANSAPEKRIQNGMRARIWAAIKGRRDGRLFSRLEYSRDELMAHLESRFLPGMTWENYGKWHIDHIRPVCSFSTQEGEDFKNCWALENLQPLWAADNIRKGVRYACP